MYGHSNSDYARLVCIHNFCVERGSRHQGVGERLMHKFLHLVRARSAARATKGQQFEVVSVVTPDKRMGFFLKCGFKIMGPSYLPKGCEPWVEMRYDLVRRDPQRSESLLSTSDTSDHMGHPFMLTGQDSLRSEPSSMSSSLAHSSYTNSSLPAFAESISETPNASPSAAMLNDEMLASILASSALSDGAARDLGISRPPTTNTPNPGKLLSSVLGQAVAAKTASEDALVALEARIVGRNHGRNLVRLYCPNGQCSCVIVGREAATWALKELGPLSSTEAIEASNANPVPLDYSLGDGDAAMSASWMEPLLRASGRITGTIGKTIGPVRGFWRLDGPMQFDNVSFSRTIPWRVPAFSAPFRSASQSSSPVPESAGKKTEDKGVPSKRSDKNLRQGLAGFLGGMTPVEKADSDQPPKQNTNVQSVSLGLTPGEERKVKYIVCPDCGCGPLGFMLLPSDVNVEEMAQKGYADNACYVAAYRLRYDL